jgi:hypothetical protein
MEMLARWARPMAIASALLLIIGVVLTGLNLLLGGWTVYAAGHVLAIAALAAFWAANRGRLDGWATLGLLVLLIGLVLALPQIAAIWQTYAPGAFHEVGAQHMELPVWTAPFGLTAELVTWVGVAFFGLAARGAHALPRGIGWLFLGAAVVGVVAALYIVSPYAWVVAELVVAIGLLAIGVSLRQPSTRVVHSG